MLDVQQAVKAAARQFDEVFKGANLEEPRLEEVELSDDDKYWLITFSFEAPARKKSVRDSVYGPTRQYKTVKVDAETGQARAIKIRVLA